MGLHQGYAATSHRKHPSGFFPCKIQILSDSPRVNAPISSRGRAEPRDVFEERREPREEPRGQQDRTMKELMAAHRLKFVRGRSERSVTLDAVLADLRRLSPEALTRCADVIRALAQAESVVQKARADQTRPAVSRTALGATCAGAAARRPLTILGEPHHATVASRRSIDSARRQSRRPSRPDRR